MSETWDHIVVGAGSAGCVVAARLAEAGRRVLLLEAGGGDDHGWVRGDPSRWDEWGAEAPGWDWRHIAPVMQGIERTALGEAAVRGRDGKVPVEQLGAGDAITGAFLDACQGCGIPANPDYNGARHEGVGRLQANTRRG